MAEQHLYPKQHQGAAAGVRAEPVFIRDPSALESLSSVLTGVSTYVANTLPTSFSMPARGFTSPSSPGYVGSNNNSNTNNSSGTTNSNNHGNGSGNNSNSRYYYPTVPGSTNPLLGGHQDNVCVLTNGQVVLFSAFGWIDTTGNILNSSKSRTLRRFCLLLGYADGFQIWDITHPDNIHEIVSIRDPGNEVSFLKVLPSPRVPPGKVDQFEQYRPLVAIISSNNTDDGASAPKRLQIYSLVTQQVVKTLDFGEGPDSDISALDVSERGIVVALTAPGESTRLIVLSQLTLNTLHAKQSSLHDASYPGVFDLGTRLLAYVTSKEAPTDTTDSKHGEHDSDSSTGYQDLAKGVAKEVFGGVKMLGGFAHQTLSSYWSGNSGAASMASTSPPMQSGAASRSPNRHSRRASASVDHPDRASAQAHHRRRHDENSPHKREAVGTVIVRDISQPNMPIVAHFKPHDHPITGCKFSPSGRLLLTVSRHGNVFHIHEVRPLASANGHGSRHVYKLARGITHASVEDIVFNEDETWVAVTTSRGTTHLYAINPFGGSPDVGAHMYTGVVNWTATAIEYPTGLNALCRIKQRHHVPEVILSEVTGATLDQQPPFSSSAAAAAAAASSLATERRRGSLHRQGSQDSVSSAGTGTSDQSQGYLNRIHQYQGNNINGAGGFLSTGAGGGNGSSGRQRAMIAAYFLPSSTVFASEPSNVMMSPGEYHDGAEGPLGVDDGGDQHLVRVDGGNHFSQAHSSTLLINRSKAPPVSTAAKLQSKASHLWHTLSPPAGAVLQHAAHGLASLPGLVVETSRRGPVATVRSRTMSWTGMAQNHGAAGAGNAVATNGARGSPSPSAVAGAGTDANGSAAGHVPDVPLAVQQQLASQGSLSEPARGPSFADIYVFNPLGMLTLHRCWVSSVRSKKTYNGRVVETSDLVLAPEDVAEWTLNRSGDWLPVKRSLAPLGGQQQQPQQQQQQQLGKFKKTNQQTGGSRWLAQSEIWTYDTGMHSGWKGQYPLLNQTFSTQQQQQHQQQQHGSTTVVLMQPQHLLWKSPQFHFQTYVGSLETVQQEFAEGKVPETKTLNLRRGVSVVAGKNNRPGVNGRSGNTNGGGSNSGSNKSWVSAGESSMHGHGSLGHRRTESHDGDDEGLSEHISSAMDSFLETHSTPPINQSRMSPSVGSASPSSFRAATLSFEDAYLISLGNASGSPKKGGFFAGTTVSQQPPAHYSQHTFLSTPPAETIGSNPNKAGGGGRRGSAMSTTGTSPGSGSGTGTGFGSGTGTGFGSAVPTMTAYTSTPVSSSALSSFAESGLNGSGYHGTGPHSTRPAQQQQQQQRGYGISNTNNAITNGRSLGPSSLHGAGTLNPMAQSTMMMFSPDGDNEVDMPGSASIYIGSEDVRHHDRGLSSKRLSSLSSSSSGGGSTLPQGGVFMLDDDFMVAGAALGSAVPAGDDRKLMEVMTNGRYDKVMGRGRQGQEHVHTSEVLDDEDEDDYEDGDDYGEL
ncbi:hypothetical protein BGZ98_002308 [Dissophora globulifera]|nr:hypothetical protein BGZ98_002308 [Dissophora globulifera]